MASEGPLSPVITTAIADGDIVWSTPANIVSSNNSDAAASNLSTVNTDTGTLEATGFGFSIPFDAIIDGIIVEVEKARESVADVTISDLLCQLIKGGTRQGDNNADATDWPTTDAYSTYGSSTDLWGLSWTPAAINNANFGVAFSATRTGSGALTDVFVDHIRVTVHYTAATGGQEVTERRALVCYGRGDQLRYSQRGHAAHEIGYVPSGNTAFGYIKDNLYTGTEESVPSIPGSFATAKRLALVRVLYDQSTVSQTVVFQVTVGGTAIWAKQEAGVISPTTVLADESSPIGEIDAAASATIEGTMQRVAGTGNCSSDFGFQIIARD